METPLSPFTPENLKPEPPQPDFFEKYRYYLLGSMVLVLGLGIYLILTPPRGVINGDDTILTDESTSVQLAATSSQFVVDIAGGVAHPGVYRLNPSSIVEDAIAAAGGFSAKADLDNVAKSINRAAAIQNHAKIYIPRLGDSQIIYTSPTPPATTPTTPTDTRINLNTASNSKLESLPGIGEIIAQRIIDYRLQNGSFTSIDELKNVPGFYDTKFETVKDLVTI